MMRKNYFEKRFLTSFRNDNAGRGREEGGEKRCEASFLSSLPKPNENLSFRNEVRNL